MKAKGKPRGKPFQKGSGARLDPRINRKGRPPAGDSTAEVMRAKLDQMKGGKTRREIIAEAQIVKAEKGDTVAARLVIERAEGHAVTPLSILPGDGGGEGLRPYIEASIRTASPENLRRMAANMRGLLLRDKGRNGGG
jgi:hypothetical protein